MTVQVIEQVEGEFRFRGFHVSLSKTTINKYIADNMEKQPSGRRWPRSTKLKLTRMNARNPARPPFS